MNDFKVCDRVYSVLHMDHIWVLKGSADMEDAIHCCYIGQKGIPKALSFSCSPAVNTVQLARLHNRHAAACRRDSYCGALKCKPSYNFSPCEFMPDGLWNRAAKKRICSVQVSRKTT